MTLGRITMRDAAVILFALMVGVAGSSCERRSVGEQIESANPTPSTAESPSEGRVSDGDVHMYRLTSETQLMELLQGLGWVEAIVLPKGEPIRVELWAGDGHWHAQTTYRSSGSRVQVTRPGRRACRPGGSSR